MNLHKTILAALLAIIMASSPSVADEKIRFRVKITGSLPTNVQGTSLAQPPSIHLIRSKRGANYFANKFKHINNIATQNRLYHLKNQLKVVNYSNQMAVIVISPPQDNYEIKIKSVQLHDGVITVNATYRHVVKNYKIPPKKAHFYSMITMKKMSQPVMLKAKQITAKDRAKKIRSVKVTGRLMKYTEDSYQLIPVKIQRHKKHSYYIRGKAAKQLAPYVGKIVTLKGTVTHEQNGPYERELTLKELVKVRE